MKFEITREEAGGDSRVWGRVRLMRDGLELEARIWQNEDGSLALGERLSVCSAGIRIGAASMSEEVELEDRVAIARRIAELQGKS